MVEVGDPVRVRNDFANPKWWGQAGVVDEIDGNAITVTIYTIRPPVQLLFFENELEVVVGQDTITKEVG
jgi:hypothetical protein